MTIKIADQVEPDAYRYLQQISNKIEIIGSSRYPQLQQSVHEKTYIDIEMMITSGGNLERLRLLRPGTSLALESILIDIIRYSAPFPPFPDELEQDRLVIQKRWVFSPNL